MIGLFALLALAAGCAGLDGVCISFFIMLASDEITKAIKEADND